MSRIFDGNASIIMNTKGVITLKAVDDGKWNKSNVVECRTTMVELGVKHKCKVYAFVPEDGGGDVPVMVYNHANAPFITLFAENKEYESNQKRVKYLA